MDSSLSRASGDDAFLDEADEADEATGPHGTTLVARGEHFRRVMRSLIVLAAILTLLACAVTTIGPWAP